ncbi:hypothetical protein WAX46_15100, partial [Bacillus sp. FJAT-53060]|uniref:hypothetical protein n=1 Tax=Bacillus sp. FJAT-53060 TaxID=3127666 RepID=UPI003013522E
MIVKIKPPFSIMEVSACRQSLQAFLYNKGNNTILRGMNMLSKREEERRNQLEVVALDELVPEDH